MAESRVLVIEDDLALRPFWEVILRRCFEEIKLDWAVSAEEAKKFYLKSLISKLPYAFIVADLFLAGSDTGLDFVQHVEDGPETVPILLVSSVDEKKLQKFIGQQNNVFVMTKPLTAPKCELTVQKILKSENTQRLLM